MVFGTSMFVAFAAALLGVLLWSLVSGNWTWRAMLAQLLYGIALAFVILNGPIQIGR